MHSLLEGADLDRLSPVEIDELLRHIEDVKRHEARRRFYTLFPDEDTLQGDGSIIHARDKYPRHIEFFNAGAQYRERCFMAANRVGKSESGAFEVSCHLTGLYPDWWRGRKFKRPVRAWAAGKTNETTRDTVQTKLCGEIAFIGGNKAFDGTGLIPGDLLGKPGWKQGVPDFADTVKVKHVSGGWSTLGLKSYQQGRSSFEGTSQHVIWMDEEPPLDVYGECLIRTATVKGITFITFTPLEGMSETVLQFMPQDQRPDAA